MQCWSSIACNVASVPKWGCMLPSPHCRTTTQKPFGCIQAKSSALSLESCRANHNMLSLLCRPSKQELRWVESMLQSKQFATIPSMPVRCRAGLIGPYSITTHSSRAIKLCSQRFRSSGIQVDLAPLVHCGP